VTIKSRATCMRGVEGIGAVSSRLRGGHCVCWLLLFSFAAQGVQSIFGVSNSGLYGETRLLSERLQRPRLCSQVRVYIQCPLASPRWNPFPGRGRGRVVWVCR